LSKRTVTFEVEDIAWELIKDANGKMVPNSPSRYGAMVVTGKAGDHEFVLVAMPLTVLHKAGTEYLDSKGKGTGAFRKHDYGSTTPMRGGLRGTTAKGRDILVGWMLAFTQRVLGIDIGGDEYRPF
jgi:hypothetical protein